MSYGRVRGVIERGDCECGTEPAITWGDDGAALGELCLADAELPVIACTTCGSEIVSAFPARLEHHEDGSHTFVLELGSSQTPHRHDRSMTMSISSPTVRDSGELDPFGEKLVALIVEPEALAYLADVLERHEFYDAGAMAIVRAIRESSSQREDSDA